MQIGAGSTAEVVVVGSTTASSVVTFAIAAGGEAYPVRFTHATGTTVQTCGTPFTHKFAALNSPLGYGGAYGAQPPTHTFTDVTNLVNTFTSSTYGTVPTSTYGARQYPSAVIKSLDFSGNAEQLLGVQVLRRLVAVRHRRDRRHQRDHGVAGRSRTGTPPSSSAATRSPAPTPTRASGNFTVVVQAADPGVLDRRRHADAVHHLPRTAHR